MQGLAQERVIQGEEKDWRKSKEKQKKVSTCFALKKAAGLNKAEGMNANWEPRQGLSATERFPVE